MRKHVACLLVLAGLMLFDTTASAREPGWVGPVFARGPLREEIESTPIEHRSYRPFHFYGNTIRRRYYRGTAVPAPRDLIQGGAVLVRPTGIIAVR